ncbi:Uncharacterised protein [Orientia tsutsugamushi]|nr:Uncharacterised protein [Orientia tsutsugamushi]
MLEIKLNLRPNLLCLFRYLSAIILNRFSIPIRLFFLSFLVKGFFLLVFFGNSELLLMNIEIDVKDSVLDLI